MTAADSSHIRLFSTDLDGTLIGNPESTRRFRLAWENLSPNERPLLVYNSGRLVPDVEQLIAAEQLPRADYLIGGVGTQIHEVRTGNRLHEFDELLRPEWDLKTVKTILERVPGIVEQPAQFQNDFKSSWYLQRATRATLDKLAAELAAAGLKTSIVYSSLRDLDILPLAATKGNALRWLYTRLGIPAEQVLVAGDTGNDSSMFLLPGVHGIVVENAQPELFEAVVEIPVYCSRQIIADGVLDGLRHFGVIRRTPTALEGVAPSRTQNSPLKMLFSDTRLGSLTTDEKNLLATGYAKAVEALKKNITPLGFSACSLTDNTVTGTDANYRSVWARDGAITLINTLDLEDEEVRTAQKRTLETLLLAIAPNGQIPANVRIDDGVPDYAGVGNICSIDSGLWVIIAFYNYVAKTQDYDLLQRHSARLQRAMDWLSAHDSNNDGLLEIPEAGDWTDLFGRSYNVLYDEVLWFRANVCYGRLLEFQGDFEKATAYLRWSQQIRGRVLDTFWPRTRLDDTGHPINRFADRQFSLGDTQYLIAEITPFSFNWRCDVFGNILAFLMNLLDVDRARTAFRFMWGVGVNNPWPVANLYPVVQSGDPDWRAYYTVNLLNLPHHYHNGGVWPFIGGMWVRMIHRLGLHEVAARELVKLAKLNQRGREKEWEFNEWAHGSTGLPMGKAYQAWSAASFIRACQEIEVDPAHLNNE
ncbi:MAG TPA: HAD-IIB family hydrolase [Opitutaceae bacterium]|nr:HAD-IIB family hydrolase [Opitutaceae bacterium]